MARRSPSSPARTPASASRSPSASSPTATRSATRPHADDEHAGAARGVAPKYGKERLALGLGRPRATLPCRAPRRGDGRRARARRRAREQRRHRDREAGSRPHRRRLRPHVRRRRARELPARAGGRAADGRRRLDREHHVGARAHPAAGLLRLRGREGCARHAQPSRSRSSSPTATSASTPSRPA